MALLTFIFLAGTSGDNGKGRLVLAQAGNGISQPPAGTTLTGVVTVTGTAAHPDYLRYELAFRHVSDPTADWIVFAEGSQPVVAGTLAVWDTTVGQGIGAPVFPDGRYQLRLRVVRTDYNYDEYFVTDLVIANVAATPTATATAVGDDAGESPLPDVNETVVATAVFQQPTPLPSLTPFPTPTRSANVAGAGDGRSQPDPTANEGVLAQLDALEIGQVGRAFWQGARLTGFIFAGLGLYLVLRALFRWGWRRFWQRKTH